MKWFLFIVSVACACFVNGQSDCRTPSNAAGECISIYNCPVLLALIYQPVRSSQEIELLKWSQCGNGFQGNEPTVCCPIKTTEFLPEKSECETASGGNGNCISVYDCPVLNALVFKVNRNRQENDLLAKSACGYHGSAPAVCCPRNSSDSQPKESCYTLDREVGECVSLYSCPHLTNMLQRPVSSESIAYVLKSKCGGKQKYHCSSLSPNTCIRSSHFCCGSSPYQNDDMVGPSGNCNAEMTAFPPDPRTKCCGVDIATGDKIVGFPQSTVDLYPWLAVIEHVKGEITLLICAGVLISGKYVLTSGHCVAGRGLLVGTPTMVRLGEYDISNEGPDCVEIIGGGQDCSDGAIRILIEKTITHPMFHPASRLKRYDIALLRLKDTAPYTDFIRPICLPTIDLTDPANVPINLLLSNAGWRSASGNDSYIGVKQQVQLPFVDEAKCKSIYKSRGSHVSVSRGHICAGSVSAKDTCQVVFGGSLMYESQNIYEVVGISSFGEFPCDVEGVPGVYTKVWEYIDWIRSSIIS